MNSIFITDIDGRRLLFVGKVGVFIGTSNMDSWNGMCDGSVIVGSGHESLNDISVHRGRQLVKLPSGLYVTVKAVSYVYGTYKWCINGGTPGWVLNPRLAESPTGELLWDIYYHHPLKTFSSPEKAVAFLIDFPHLIPDAS